ncbi:ATP-binding cassette domain-containing protein [[Eubacterium] cellulosolvens]
MIAIQTKNLTKRFDKLVAVDNLNLEISEGELFGFLGPNGAGKTTTISMLCTILRPTSGSAKVWGYDIIKEQTQVRRAIGIVFQDPSLDENLTARENLEFHGRLYKVPKKLMKRRMEELLELMELSNRIDDLVKTYSGGMRRRLEIARGLLHHPKVLFLDEPTLGLDPQTRIHIWKYIEKLNKREGITMLLTTHYMHEADYLCNNIAIIDEGKIVAKGSPKALKDSLGGDVVTLTTKTGGKKLSAELLKLKNVKTVDYLNNSIRITSSHGESVIPTAIDLVRARGIKIETVSLHGPTLEDVYIKFTGKRLRDEPEGKKGQFKRSLMSRGRMKH